MRNALVISIITLFALSGCGSDDKETRGRIISSPPPFARENPTAPLNPSGKEATLRALDGRGPIQSDQELLDAALGRRGEK